MCNSIKVFFYSLFYLNTNVPLNYKTEGTKNITNIYTYILIPKVNLKFKSFDLV